MLAAGLQPSALETSFTGLARFFGRRLRRTVDRDQVFTIVEVGASGSTILILRGDHIALCKPIPVGGDHFDCAVAEHLQMDVPAASEIRAARIRSNHAGRPAGTRDCDPSTDRAVYESVRPHMSALVKEVLLCQRYYGVTFRGQPPCRIILTGGDGLEPRLDEMLARDCKIPVSCDDPAGTLAGLESQLHGMASKPALAGASWAACAGLSLRGVHRRRRDESSTVPRRAA
jgi:type IV pilus assembly protein PilM